jgi:hypothetical protein
MPDCISVLLAGTRVLKPVLRIRDVYPRSEFFHPRSRVKKIPDPDPGVKKAPDPDSGVKKTPDPDPGVKKAPDPDPGVKKSTRSGSTTLPKARG